MIRYGEVVQRAKGFGFLSREGGPDVFVITRDSG